MEASESTTSGGLTGSSQTRRSGTTIDHRATYALLHDQLLRLASAESTTRSREQELLGGLRTAHHTCVALGQSVGSLGFGSFTSQCAGLAGRASGAFTDLTTARRLDWSHRFVELGGQAHRSWRILNTSCRDVGGGVQECEYGDWYWIEGDSFTRHLTSFSAPPQTIVLAARDSLTPGKPVIRMNPHVDWEQIVHVPTWLWIERDTWRTYTARAEAGDTWAEVTAVPVRVVWDMGDGHRVVCHGPGTAYDPRVHESRQHTSCSYPYRQSTAGVPGERYTVTATVVYDVTWEGSGGAGGDLGTISVSDQVRIRVAEIQALNT